MASDRGVVLLCTGTSGDEDKNYYPAQLEEVGFQCKFLQALQFEYVNLQDLQDHLLAPESYHGEPSFFSIVPTSFFG